MGLGGLINDAVRALGGGGDEPPPPAPGEPGGGLDGFSAPHADVIGQLEQQAGYRFTDEYRQELSTVLAGLYATSTVGEAVADLGPQIQPAGQNISPEVQAALDKVRGIVPDDVPPPPGPIGAVGQRLVNELGMTPAQAAALLEDPEQGPSEALLLLDKLGESTAAGPVGRDPGLAEGTRLDNLLKQRDLDANPNLTTVTDERTGESFALDTVTGERTSLGRFGFAGIDPERDFQQSRGVNQANINQGIGQEDRLRRGLEQSAQIANQSTDVQRFDRLQDILRNPSDFIARAFLQRGVQSPTGQITHADLVNALHGEIRDVDAPKFKKTLESLGVDLSAPEFQPQPAPVPPARNTADSGGLTNEKKEEFQDPKNLPAPLQEALGLKPTNTVDDPAFGAVLNSAGTLVDSRTGTPGFGMLRVDPRTGTPGFGMLPSSSLPTPTIEDINSQFSDTVTVPTSRFNFQEQDLDEFNQGGTTRLGKFLVGDSPGGGTNSTTEMIVNPTNAPIGVVANKDLKKKKKGIARFALGTFNDGSLDDLFPGVPGAESGTARREGTSGGLREMPQVTGGRSLFSGNVTQNQLIQDARSLSPPAVSSLFDQTPVAPLNFGFNLFTPNQTNQLTSAEQEALNSRLGVEFNTTLQDVVEGQRQRFGKTRERGRGRLQL